MREDVVRALAKAGHKGMMKQVKRLAEQAQAGQIDKASTGLEVVSALFTMCSQGVEVGLRMGCTRESLRMAIHGLYALVADEEHPQ